MFDVHIQSDMCDLLSKQVSLWSVGKPIAECSGSIVTSPNNSNTAAALTCESQVCGTHSCQHVITEMQCTRVKCVHLVPATPPDRSIAALPSTGAMNTPEFMDFAF